MARSASSLGKGRDFTERELNNSLTSYKITGLAPGEVGTKILLLLTLPAILGFLCQKIRILINDGCVCYRCTG